MPTIIFLTSMLRKNVITKSEFEKIFDSPFSESPKFD